MTDEKDKEEDLEQVPIKRTLTMASILWSFEKWKSPKDRWKNELPYQALHAMGVLRDKYGDIFKEIRTGCETKLTEEQLDDVGIPVLHGVNGLGKRNLFFIYKDGYNKNNKAKIGD